MCSASNVYKSMVSKKLSEKTATYIYFPFLKEKNVFNISDLKDRQIALLDSNNVLINERFAKQVDNIDLFHNIYNTRKGDLNYIEQGIQMMEFSISQEIEYNLPLDIIFKLIHATKTVPFIKYNPSKNKENIYRLYCDKMAKNGKKIPYLSKNVIFKLMKTVGNSKRVSCYIEYNQVDGQSIPITLEFDSYANIYVNMEFKQTYSISAIEKIVQSAINPIIEIVQQYLKNSGYNMNLFSTFYNNNVEIFNMKYYAYIAIEKNINLNNILGCVSSIFNVVVGELKNGIVMRYKRVANFNEMDSQEAFIVELLNNTSEEQDIVKALMDNFQLKELDAQMKIAQVLNNIQVVQNLNKKRRLRIKNSHGFLTKITQDRFKQNIMIEMENINNIFYMNSIPIYLDSLIRVTQKPDTSAVEVSTIDTLCKTKAIDDAIQIEEIVAPSERSIGENIPVAIIAQDLAFGDATAKSKDKSVNVLDFLFADDDDEDEDDEDDNNDNKNDSDDGFEIEYVGGNDSPDSPGIDVELDEDDGDDDSISMDIEDSPGIDVELDEDDLNTSSPAPPVKEPTPTPTPPVKEPTPPPTPTPPPPPSPPVKEPTPPPSPQVKEPVAPKKMLKKKVKLQIVDNFNVDDNQNNNMNLNDNDENVKMDITGMKIADPNPFFKSMYEKDPTLFLTESDGKYSAYSRVCPWNKRRQPVILTDEEKEKIDREHPGSYEHAIKYGSNPDKQYWYICPRYWDLKNNTSLTEQEVKSGKYGGIIPQDAKVVPRGKNIWEFNDAEGAKPIYHIDKYGKYVQHYPGFLKEDVHPDGLRVPCCFKIWRDPSNIVAPKQEVDEYIIGSDKFPLESGRFGYLPASIQRFIQTDNKKCQISNVNTNLKKEQPCYLRKGIENSTSKSFIACISDIYGEMNNDIVLTIDNLIRDKIIPLLTLDNFVRYQNGNLITSFKSKDITSIELQPLEMSEHKESIIYKTMYDKNQDQLKSITSAHSNFKEYIQSPSSVIDYEYLWDLISDKNDNFFKNGLNIIILELPLDDITANINIICPTNFYSVNKFDSSKDTAILIKKYEYFEPIYIVVDKSKTNLTKLVTTKIFTPELMAKVPNLKSIANTIQDIYNSMCKPLSSITNIASKYNFKEIKFVRNNTLEKTIDILNKYDIQIKNTVINYDNKVIGVNVVKNNNSGFIPCFPSGIMTEYPIITMNENTDWKSFEETISFLNSIYRLTEGNILCKPVVKILDDGLMVGILTQTNQFIELNEPEQDTDISIKYSIDDENYYHVNKIVQTSRMPDMKRIEYVKKIRLETELYNTFRNRLKKMFNQFSNKAIRDEIEGVSKSPYMVYHLQLEKIISLIKKIMKDEVEFVLVNDSTIKNIEDNLRDGTTLLIPKTNLLSNLDNENIYYSKISDELIRYNRIKQFMFEPKMYLSFSDVKYNLNENEILLLQSLLTSDYFDNLTPYNKSKYITFNTYDTVEPSITQNYDNEYIKSTVEIKPTKKLKIDDQMDVITNINNINDRRIATNREIPEEVVMSTKAKKTVNGKKIVKKLKLVE